jgi:hypothetical protein
MMRVLGPPPPLFSYHFAEIGNAVLEAADLSMPPVACEGTTITYATPPVSDREQTIAAARQNLPAMTGPGFTFEHDQCFTSQEHRASRLFQSLSHLQGWMLQPVKSFTRDGIGFFFGDTDISEKSIRELVVSSGTKQKLHTPSQVSVLAANILDALDEGWRAISETARMTVLDLQAIIFHGELYQHFAELLRTLEFMTTPGPKAAPQESAMRVASHLLVSGILLSHARRLDQRPAGHLLLAAAGQQLAALGHHDTAALVHERRYRFERAHVGEKHEPDSQAAEQWSSALRADPDAAPEIQTLRFFHAIAHSLAQPLPPSPTHTQAEVLFESLAAFHRSEGDRAAAGEDLLRSLQVFLWRAQQGAIIPPAERAHFNSLIGRILSFWEQPRDEGEARLVLRLKALQQTISVVMTEIRSLHEPPTPSRSR